MMGMAKKYKLEISPATLEKIVHMSVFHVAEKGKCLRHIGDETKNAGLVLSGIARCFFIDENGNDITRGFSISGTLCMDEGMFGYAESLTEWETLEETTLMVFNVEQIKYASFLQHPKYFFPFINRQSRMCTEHRAHTAFSTNSEKILQ